jgi:AcrR family transcriptional regulator
MAGERKPAAPTRTPLSRERVLRAAIRIADDGGIEALSMRRLAQALGVEAMTLYHYVARKDDILDSIVELVVSDIPLPAEGEAWRPALRRIAIGAHEQFLRHRWAAGLTLSARLKPGRARYMDAILGTLRRGGFSASMAHHGYHAIESHIVGFTLWLVGIRIGMAEYDGDVPRMLGELPLSEFPWLAEHIDEHRLEDAGGGAAVSEFEFGLDLILDGLERLRGPE